MSMPAPYRRRPTLVASRQGPAAVLVETRAGPITIVALPAVVDLELYQGDDFTFALTVLDPGDTPTDLTGTTVRSQIRATPADPNVAGLFTPSVAANVITLWLPWTVSTVLPSTCVWDVEMIRPGNRVTTLARGDISMTPEVTR